MHEFDYRPAERSNLGAGATVLLLMPEDRRPEVVTGDERPSFVGELRSGAGIPYSVKTKDGQPFAAVVAETVERDLEAAGFRVVVDPGPAGLNLPARLHKSEARRALAVTIREFHSDTYIEPTVTWELVATVFDEHGSVVASDTRTGEMELPGSFWNPKKAAARQVPPFFYRLVHELVAGNPIIVDALKG
ncbi:hypothetical protein [Nannocystis punicea]|uniref:Uncharacterized protein n=1 Tax=Nannocystis punicea TaxID=2995304 RepID=A0ABY7HET4_9BACT|nr:hypothetical protein [Nannocystis poenicansa]WAS97792.1 hypothetical protein O0S08_16745 [Nannocystis poenicansa]